MTARQVYWQDRSLLYFPNFFSRVGSRDCDIVGLVLDGGGNGGGGEKRRVGFGGECTPVEMTAGTASLVFDVDDFLGVFFEEDDDFFLVVEAGFF
jgi:hypothetical protein